MGLDKWIAATPYILIYSDVAYGNVAGKDEFVAVGSVAIATSSDQGTNWTNSSTPEVYNGVAWGNGAFVLVGGHVRRWNGVAWSVPVSQSPWSLRAVAHGTPLGGLFVAVGDGGTIKTTSDGISWTAVSSGIPLGLNAIAYGNQRFVAAAGSTILTSPDGITWTKSTPLLANPLVALAFGGGRFVGVDNSKRALTSLDGASWTNLGTVPGSASVAGIVYGFDTWVAVGAGGSIHTSVDGIGWTTRSSGSTQHLGGVAYGKNRFVAVGAGPGGHIVRSGEYPSADLSALTCSAGAVTPPFDPLLTGYSAQLTKSVATVTPTSEDPLATIHVRFDAGSNVAVGSGTPSAVGQLGGRAHKFFITVTARNNATKVYALTVSRTWALRLFDRLWRFPWP